MLNGLKNVALRKRQEAELEVSEVKMFSLEVTRMDWIRNEYSRWTVHVRCFGRDGQRGQTEMVWTCTVEV